MCKPNSDIDCKLNLSEPIPIYETPSRFSTAAEIHVEPISMDNIFLSQPHYHRHTFYEWIVILKGSGTHHIDFEVLDIKPNHIYFIQPGQVHMIEPGSDLQGFYITFSKGSALTKDIEMLLFELDYKPAIDLKGGGEIKTVLNALSREIETHKPFKEEIIANYFDLMCLMLKRAIVLNDIDLPHIYPDIVKEFFHIIRYKPKASLTVKKCANNLYVTPRYISELIKKVTGTNAKDWIAKNIIMEAKRLLAFTQKSIEEVARELEFEEIAYFYKYFKRYTTLTPNEFRKKAERGKT